MTRSPALRVPAWQGESARRRLLDRGALRTDLRLRREGESLLLPLVDGHGVNVEGGELIEAEFEEFKGRNEPASYRDLVDCSPELRERLPRSFDVVGDIVLIRIPSELESAQTAIGEALLHFVPNTRIVGRDLGVHGPERRRTLVRIAGVGDWRTVHHENGIAFQVDVESAYFSPRLAREHDRVAQLVRAGEEVYDLCCGVGPFSLSIAKEGRAKRVVAVDSNPAAIALLRESLARAKGRDRVEAVDADVAAFLAEAAPVDRAILNLPHEGIKYLPSVARRVRPGGAIHYYEVVARDAFPRRTEELVHETGGPSRWAISEHHLVHPYSPASDLVAFTLISLRETGGA